MAKRTPSRRDKASSSKPILMMLLGFALRVVVAVFRKRSQGSGKAPRRPAGRGNTHPGIHRPSPALQRAKARQKSGARKEAPAAGKARGRGGDHPITLLQRAGAEGHWIQSEGVIVKNLPDDLEGSRHQRFLVELSDGHVIKISHNIDLAPRVPAKEGDSLGFAGDFESNELGGALHWTHLDPRKWHADGWIEHRGKRYE